MQLYSSNSFSQVTPIARPQSQAYSEALTTFWRVKPPVAKKTQKNFKISGFQHFLRLSLATGLQVEAPVASLLRMLHDSLCDLLATRPSNHEKHLNKFFKICGMGFWRLDLVTCSRLILVAKNACFAQIGLYSRQFSKTIQFPLHHVLVHCLVCLSLFQNHHFHSQNLHFLHQSFINLQEKVWVFSYSQNISCFQPQNSWILCFC